MKMKKAALRILFTVVLASAMAFGGRAIVTGSARFVTTAQRARQQGEELALITAGSVVGNTATAPVLSLRRRRK
jgi:hypothetical protein